MTFSIQTQNGTIKYINQSHIVSIEELNKEEFLIM